MPTRRPQAEGGFTAEDNQSAVTIKVFQGERQMAHNSKLLAQFDLVGMPQIEVEFDIDVNGMAQLTAGGLTAAEIRAMTEGVRFNAQLDEQRKDATEARNQAESLICSTGESLKAHGGKLSEQDKHSIVGQLRVTKDALAHENEPIGQLQSKTKQLMEVSTKLEQSTRSSEAPANRAESEPPAN